MYNKSMRKVVYILTFLLVYYSDIDYELEVFTYDGQDFEIEVTCAEGYADCKGKPLTPPKPLKETRELGSYLLNSHMFPFYEF